MNPCFVLTVSVCMHGTLLVLSTYCTRWKTYAHTLICPWHKKTISQNRPFFCLTRLVHFRNAPTLLMTFARATRKIIKICRNCWWYLKFHDRMHAPLRKCTVYWWVNRWLTLPIRSNTPMRNQSLPKPLRIQSRTNSRKPFGHSWPKMGMRHVALTPPFEPTLSRIPSWMFWFSSYLMISANILSSYLVNRLRKTSACQTCSSLLSELVRLKLHKICSNEGQDVTSAWHQSPPLVTHHSDWFLQILLQNQCFCV